MDNNSNTQNNIWQEILKEANTNKDFEDSHVFIFGDKNCGKRTLLKSINKELYLNYENEDKTIPNLEEGISRFSYVDFKYLNVKKINDTDNEIISKMHVWMINTLLEDDIFFTIFKPEFLNKAVVIITVDLSKPGEILDQIKTWCRYFYEKFSKLLMRLPIEKQKEIIKNQEDYIKLWEDEQSDNEGNKPEKMSEEMMMIKLNMPLKEKLLEINLGVPVVFLINKSDIVHSTNERKRYEEDSEFILKHIRRVGLTYGASIIYSSTKTNTNIQLLYEYLLHRLFKFEFSIKPNIIDKDSYFIPSGYDSMSLLKSFDLSGDLEKIYNEKILGQKTKTISAEEEIHCEDSQQFLKKFYEKTEKTMKMNSFAKIPISQSSQHEEDSNYNTNTSTNQSNSNVNKPNNLAGSINKLNLSQSKINPNPQNPSGNPSTTTTNYDALKEKLNKMRVANKPVNPVPKE